MCFARAVLNPFDGCPALHGTDRRVAEPREGKGGESAWRMELEVLDLSGETNKTVNHVRFCR